MQTEILEHSIEKSLCETWQKALKSQRCLSQEVLCAQMLPNQNSYFGNYNPHAPKHVKSEEKGENSPATGWDGEEGLSAHPFQDTKPEGS